jgi:hypothetical protein
VHVILDSTIPRDAKIDIAIPSFYCIVKGKREGWIIYKERDDEVVRAD